MSMLVKIGVALGTLVGLALIAGLYFFWPGGGDPADAANNAGGAPTAAQPALACPTGFEPETISGQEVCVEQQQPAQPTGTQVARELGPWAPVQGVGPTFEVTCNENVCDATHVQLWWPHSNTPWGNKEISTVLPAGLSVEVQAGAGRGWEYPLGYGLQRIEDEITADNERRTNDTSYHGRITIDELINLGLVTVRFDRRDGASSPPAAPATATRDGNADNRTLTPPTGEIWAVEAWEPVNGFVIIQHGESFSGAKGALWKYNTGNLNAVLADLQGRGDIYLVTNGQLVQQ